ncbi:MAG: amino acid permease [Chitinophagaceae bacterium]|nr:amino acid permease [Oligoflexus sp.]
MAELKKSLGLIPLLFYGIGMILGAGIYSVIGAATAKSQGAVWISFLIAAFIALLTGLSYAELATKMPEAGAEYSYLRKAFPKRRYLGFVVGIVVCVLGAATAATVSLAFANYLQGFIKLPLAPVALAVMGVAALINIIGLKASSKLNILFTLIEVSGLAIVTVLGLQSERFANDITFELNPGVLPAAALLFFSYLGFESIVALSEESKNPSKHIPIAIIGSILITTFVYLMVALATIALVNPDQLVNDEAPLQKIVGAGAPGLVPTIQAIALFATSNTALIAILSASRVAFAMARKKDLPEAITGLASKNGSPWIATLLIFGIGALMIPFGKVEVVAEITSFLSLAVFAAVHISLIVLRFIPSADHLNFTVPLKIGLLPILPCVALISIAFMMSQFNVTVYSVGAGVIGGALLLYWLLHRFTNLADNYT